MISLIIGILDKNNRRPLSTGIAKLPLFQCAYALTIRDLNKR